MGGQDAGFPCTAVSVLLGFARVRCRWHHSPIAREHSECFDRQHRIASSRGEGVVEAQLSQECNHCKSQLWMWMNLVFCYWT